MVGLARLARRCGGRSRCSRSRRGGVSIAVAEAQHLVGGLVGTVAIGFLATEGGLLFGGGFALLITQVLIALAALVFSGVVTFAVAKLLEKTIGWRVSDKDELLGIDLTQHAETAYEPQVLAGNY